MAPKRKRDDVGPPAAMTVDRQILIAVDFGTTGSTMCWGHDRRPGILSPITQWPDGTANGIEGITREKVPTEILYIGDDAIQWGFEIEQMKPRHKWFKLDLDPSQIRGTSLAQTYEDHMILPPQYESGPDEAEKHTANYLAALVKHKDAVLKSKLPPSALASAVFVYIITVPALWSPAATMRTLRAAEKAGMCKAAPVQVISEPEAAAIWSIDAIGSDDFAIDLITYTISQLNPVLKLTEAAPGSGSVCGSTFINRIFQKWLEDVLKDDPNWDDQVRESATRDFENDVKKRFKGTWEDTYFVSVAGIEDNVAHRVKRGKMTLLGKDVRSFFEPVFSEIIKLVLGQIEAAKRPIKGVLLVGGFGENPYLRDEIAKEVKRISPTTWTMQPPNGWTAVVRGACMRGLSALSATPASVIVSERRARRFYGISSSESFVNDRHSANLRYWDGYSGAYRISTMDWFVKKGDIVEEQKPAQLKYRMRKLKSEGSFGTISTSILAYSDPTNVGAPIYSSSMGVQHLVTVKADLSLIPEYELKQKRGQDGKTYYYVSFAIEITHYSAHTKYELVHNGNNYGPVVAECV